MSVNTKFTSCHVVNLVSKPNSQLTKNLHVRTTTTTTTTTTTEIATIRCCSITYENFIEATF